MTSPKEEGHRVLSSIRTKENVEFCYGAGVTAETFQFAPAGEDDVDHSRVFTYLCRQLLKGRSPTDEDLKTLHGFERGQPGDLEGYVEELRSHEINGRFVSIFGRQRKEFGLKSLLDAVRDNNDPEKTLSTMLKELSLLNTARTRRWVRGDQVKVESVKWLWHRHIREGELTIIEGDPEAGKSIFALMLAVHVSVGTEKLPWPTDNGRERLEPAKVLVLTLEDDLDSVVIPRFKEWGGDLANFTGIHKDAAPPNLTTELHEVDSKLSEGGYKLMVLDSLDDFIPSIDNYRASEVRAVLMPIVQLARRHGVAIIGLKHLRKSETSKAIYRGLDSIAYNAVARGILLVEKNPDVADESERIVAIVKGSVGLKAASWAFRLKPSKRDPDTPTFEWLDERDITADQLLRTEKKQRVTKTNAASMLLFEALEDHEWHESAPLLARFMEDGNSQSTYSRAWAEIKASHNGEEKWSGSGKNRKMLYRLPDRHLPY